MKTFFKINTWHKPKLVHPNVWFWLYALLCYFYLKSQCMVHAFDSSIVSTILNILSVLVKWNQTLFLHSLGTILVLTNFCWIIWLTNQGPCFRKCTIWSYQLPRFKIFVSEVLSARPKIVLQLKIISYWSVFWGKKQQKNLLSVRVWCLFPFSGMH